MLIILKFLLISFLAKCFGFDTDLVCFNTSKPFNLTIQCSLRIIWNPVEGFLDFGDGSSETFKTG